ncbi:MAG TPA: Crp/Fnr family transcriptional regulator [Anaerolineales bacterium]|nr:Crp/Fnr family transcriptional regulator [Anaerolineales bacterium]
MPSVVFWGLLDRPAAALFIALRSAGRDVLVLADLQILSGRWPATDVIVLLDLGQDMWVAQAQRCQLAGFRWLGWDRSGRPQIGLHAYQLGAAAVFPGEMTPDALLAALERQPLPVRAGERNTTERRYPRGALVLPDEGTVVDVLEGVLASRVTHPDGAQVLLGLSGPGQLVVSHPHDSCSLQMEAHTDVRLLIRPWEQAERMPRFGERLRDRLQQLEAWASMQARPHLDQRLLGLLSLLAESFGREHPHGMLIDLRLTQGQLASAANATRSTVTRAIGQLRRRGLLTTVGRGDGERFCLTRLEPHRHHHTGTGPDCVDSHSA